jgi:hypothetical protein
MKRFTRLSALGLTAVFAALGLMVFAGGAGALLDPGAAFTGDDEDAIVQDGTAELRDVAVGNFLTECPQAGLRDKGDSAQPLDRRQVDDVEKLSIKSDNIRPNQDYSCMPQDETSLDVNPKNLSNIVGGANDYRLGTGSSGFYATTDRGKHWYDGIIPFPSAGAAVSRGEGFIVSGGDPAIAYDRAGVVYYAQLAFFRGDDTGGVFVSRSTNGGFTWSRARIGGANTPTPSPGPNTDPRQPGDGVVNFIPDNDTTLNGSVDFNDKEYIATGPRPEGVAPQCFAPDHTPAPSCNPDTVGVDRVYVSWTLFLAGGGSQIVISYSDDQGRSWSAKKVINGSAAFCVGRPANDCRDNQGSVPTVNPTTGQLWVGFLNGNTPDEDQYLVVTSKDGGNTFTGPNFVTPIYDINYPRANSTRPDCVNRGAQTRSTLTNSCFRVNSYGNIVADRRGGAFADDLYVVIDDNRNGTPASSNVDVFYLRSTDGGVTWIGPTRVNDDRSVAPPNRDCGRTEGNIATGTGVNAACGGVVDYGNDQWFPWIDVSPSGTLNVGFFDRRLDKDSTASEWPTSRSRPGNYLTWFFGASCRITSTATVPATGTAVPAGAGQCNADQAIVNRQPTAAVNPGTTVPGANQTGLPFRNFQVSDVPFNLDYAFRGGIFVGDYNNVAVPDTSTTAYGFWTDSRNGRSSGGPGGGATNPSEPGRNPLCEQSDVFMDTMTENDNVNDQSGHFASNWDPFLVSLCPPAAQDKRSTNSGDGG